jgi:RNA recognition motif-containing protein
VEDVNIAKASRYAYVVFKNQAAVTKALELNGHELDGKPIRIQPFTTKESPQTLYVCNFSPQTTEQALREAFQAVSFCRF